MIHDRRILSIAVASGRVGHVVLEGANVVHLGMSKKASMGPAEARAFTAQALEDRRPDVVVTEKVLKKSKKGSKTRSVIKAITEVADCADVLNFEVSRGRSHDSRFDEARELAARYPKMEPYLPSGRKPWEAEPKTLIYFEALSLIESALGRISAPNQ
ncbi:hypothetical protein GV827_17580 [Sulfitobacter sp. JBTF-M27]|uniref:Holliday junction resolvase RuvX n=1 Tax=Sulfitobacter sediminilitoris TaxID=2698830 RepID=A0A6P0CFN5_9RHOB|nr:hypothetical protein [Sulfitobacter sediminilitoris]NEK24200.1 hypothetical protein [Sulfitobacter sediminilitoris]